MPSRTPDPVADAVVRARQTLEACGLPSNFTVKVRSFQGRGSSVSDWIGMYRSGTAIRGGRPVIWLNSDLASVLASADVPPERLPVVVEDTIYHEFGHIIFEWLAHPTFGSRDDVQGLLDVYDDEEEFAETFVYWVKRRVDSSGQLSPSFQKIGLLVDRYIKFVRGEDQVESIRSIAQRLYIERKT
jgi:hypothetical protein